MIHNIGGVFDLAFDIYRKHFWSLITTFALLVVPVQAIQYLLFDFWWRPINSFADAHREDLYANIRAGAGALFLGYPQAGVPGILALITFAIASAPITFAVADIYRGKTPVWQECYRRAIVRLPILLLSWVIMGLCFCALLLLSTLFASLVAVLIALAGLRNPEVLGMITLIIGLLTPYLLTMTLGAAMFLFTTPLVVLERLPIMAIPARNWQLIGRKRLWSTWMAVAALPIVFVTLHFAMLSSIMSLIPLIQLPNIMHFFLGTAINTGLILFLYPYILIFVAVFYFNSRFYRDALDLHLLAKYLPAPLLPTPFADEVATVFSSNPIPSNPIPSNPIPSNPIPSNPIPSNPIPSNSISSTSVLPVWFGSSQSNPQISAPQSPRVDSQVASATPYTGPEENRQ